MLANVSAALQHFRRRLRLRAFAAGSTLATTCLAGGGAAVLVALHLSDHGAPAWLRSTWLGAAAPVAVVLGAALLWGWLRAARTRADDARLCEHLEQRLGTGGLLLVAGEGVAVPEPFAQRLAEQLQRTAAVLPPVDLAPRLWRPVLALVLLVGVTLLPAPRSGGGAAATAAAVGKLGDRIEALAADPRLPDDARDELQAVLQDLEHRVAAGEDNLWREIDQLTERVDREVAGAAASGGGTDGRGDGGGAVDEAVAEARQEQAQQARAARLAEAAQLLQQAGGGAGELLTEQLAEQLPESARELLDAARDEQGGIDAARLAADPRLTPELTEQLTTALAAALEALAADAATSPELVEQASQLAADLAPASSAAQADADPSPSFAPSPEQLQELMQSVAEGASALAGISQSLDGLAGSLTDALGGAASELAAQALEQVDIASLMALLPDDPQQLQALAERLGELARGAAQSPPGSPSGAAGEQGQSGEAGRSGPPGNAAAQQPTTAQRAQLQQLAQRLTGAVAGARAGAAGNNGESGSPGRPGQGESGAGQSGSRQSNQEQAGQGQPNRGPGHAALRMTEHAVGETTGELELPTPVDPTQLSREWRPADVQKAEPEVGAPRAAEPGGDAATGGSGAATWQLRLMPRHREVVRRFFGGGDSPAPATGGGRGGDKK